MGEVMLKKVNVAKEEKEDGRETADLKEIDNVEVIEKKVMMSIVDDSEERRKLIVRIENIVLNVMEQICSGTLPSLSYKVPCSLLAEWQNKVVEMNNEGATFHGERMSSHCDIKRTSVDFSSKKSKEKMTLLILMMSRAHQLLISNSSVTRRSFYYDLKSGSSAYLVRSQRQIDLAAYNLAYLLACPPWCLRILPAPKGLAAGKLSLTLLTDQTIDYNVPGGRLIPDVATNITSICTKANFVLIVEKDAVFQKLLAENCPRALNCILITGRGYPDLASRMLIKLLSEKMGHPAYILVDADPFGIDIMCIYRFGSMALSKDRDQLACSAIRWLGIHPSELTALGVSSMPLTSADLSKLKSIESRRSLRNDDIRREMKVLRKGKAGIEAIAGFTKNFLTATYLPSKIKGTKYI